MFVYIHTHMCVRVYIYIHNFMYTCIYTRIHMYVCVYVHKVHVYIRTYMCVYMHKYMPTCIHTYSLHAYILESSHTPTDTHTFWGVAGYIVLESKFSVYIHILTCIRASMGACMHVCIYTHINICIHIYNACTCVYTVYTRKHMHVCKYTGCILVFLTTFNESWPPWIQKATPYESRSINLNQPTIYIWRCRISLRNQHWQIFLTAFNGSWPPHQQKPRYTNGIQSILATLQSTCRNANLPCVFGRFFLK